MIIKEKPVIKTFSGTRFDPRKRKVVKITFKKAVCGVCGNPVTPYVDKHWCGSCYNQIDWGKYSHKFGSQFVFNTRGIKNIICRGYENI